MNTGLLRRWSIASACLAILLVVALILNLVFGEETTAEDVIGEPLDAATKARFQGTHLNFIAETGRIVVNEHGTREIIWDPPQLPTVEELIRMAEAGDTSLLPLCTQEYQHYLRKQKESGAGSLCRSPHRSQPSKGSLIELFLVLHLASPQPRLFQQAGENVPEQ